MNNKKYCCDDFKNAVGDSKVLYYTDDDEWWTNMSYEDDDFIIYFCPFCGKKL